MSVKKGICLLFVLLLCWPLAAWAESAEIAAEAAPHEVRFAFDVPEYAFVYLKYDTQRDGGSQVLYSENGHFEGVCALLGTFDDARVGINVATLAGSTLLQTRLNAQPDPTPGAPAAGLSAEKVSSRIQDPEITAGADSVHYRFAVPGRDTLEIKCKSPQEWHRITIYAGADYVFEGDVPMPLTFPDDAITFSVSAANGTLLYEEELLVPYTAPSLPWTLTDTVLSGVTVCVDPGHQRTTQVETVYTAPNFNSKTTTTVGMARGRVTRRRESQLVLEIGMQLRNALLQRGAGVITTRDKQDTFVGMLERADIPNRVNADFVLRLHCNSRDSADIQGIEVYYPQDSSYARAVADADAYREMSQTLLDAIHEATGMNKGFAKPSNNYVGNNWSQMPSFLIEMGYMTNMEEDLLLSSPAYQARLVEGMVEGVIRLARLRGLIE